MKIFYKKMQKLFVSAFRNYSPSKCGIKSSPFPCGSLGGGKKTFPAFCSGGISFLLPPKSFDLFGPVSSLKSGD